MKNKQKKRKLNLVLLITDITFGIVMSEMARKLGTQKYLIRFTMSKTEIKINK